MNKRRKALYIKGLRRFWLTKKIAGRPDALRFWVKKFEKNEKKC